MLYENNPWKLPATSIRYLKWLKSLNFASSQSGITIKFLFSYMINMDGLFGDNLFVDILTIIKLWESKEECKGGEPSGENEENDDFDREDDEKEETDEEDESLKVLRLRYAKGEISREDFEQKKKDLEEN
jgi:uncharacterized membrane protein